MTGGASLVVAPYLGASARDGSHLQEDDTIGILLDHPAFAGFAPLLLPWDGRPVDRSMQLSRMGTIMPYHTHVDPHGTTLALNRMIDDVARGRTVFFDIYGEGEKGADPDKARTGLFFFRGRPGAPFAVVCPGGGFSYVGSLHEGFPYAAAIADAGDNAFVLRYRPCRGERAATEDLAAALATVLVQANALGVARDGYSLWGSSAGARSAANVGSHGADAYGQGVLPRPAAVIMAYTGHSDRAATEPPTFAIVGERDGIAPPATMARRIDVLRRTGTPVEFRVVPGLGHGFGLGSGTAAEGWAADALRFWVAQRPPAAGSAR